MTHFPEFLYFLFLVLRLSIPKFLVILTEPSSRFLRKAKKKKVVSSWKGWKKNPAKINLLRRRRNTAERVLYFSWGEQFEGWFSDFFSVLHEQTREHFTWIVPLYVFECKGKLCNHSSKRVARSQKVSGTPLNFSLYHYFSIIKLNPFFSGKFCEMLIGIQHCNFQEVPPWSISTIKFNI